MSPRECPSPGVSGPPGPSLVCLVVSAPNEVLLRLLGQVSLQMGNGSSKQHMRLMRGVGPGPANPPLYTKRALH